MPQKKEKVDVFNLSPEEAIEYFKKKGLVLTFHWYDLWKDEHQRAFVIAKMMDLELLKDTKEALKEALEQGKSLEQFAKELYPILEAKGWIGWKETIDPDTGEVVKSELGTPRRIELIYRQNLAVAYEIARFLYAEEIAEDLPYLRYVATLDDRTRPEHAEWNGVTLPIGDSFWDTHYPPNGWNCRCSTIQLTAEQAETLTGKREKPKIKYADWENPLTGKTEKVPEGIDPGWDYNPARRQEDELENALKEMENEFLED